MEPRLSIITLGVEDMRRSYRFYHDGLGFPTSANEDSPIVFFQMQGSVLAIYPRKELARDVDPASDGKGSGFSGVTIAHNTRTKDEVDEILHRAETVGGKIQKPAQNTAWGGYSGYFSDPDGHLWEVAWAEAWKFHPDGSLIVE